MKIEKKYKSIKLSLKFSSGKNVFKSFCVCAVTLDTSIIFYFLTLEFSRVLVDDFSG